jgi:hypothetical protein
LTLATALPKHNITQTYIEKSNHASDNTCKAFAGYHIASVVERRY